MVKYDRNFTELKDIIRKNDLGFKKNILEISYLSDASKPAPKQATLKKKILYCFKDSHFQK